MLEIGERIPYNPKLKERTRELRKNMTIPEKKMWYNFFQDFQKNYKIRVHKQRPIDNFIVDFYIPKCKMVIEIDGDTHFSQQGKVYDAERSSILKGYKLKILRFTNNEVMKNFEGVCEKILEEVIKQQNSPGSFLASPSNEGDKSGATSLSSERDGGREKK